MRIPLEFYSHIRDTVRVSDVVRLRLILTKKGGEYLGVCPFHSEKTPSFTVNDSKKFYHCFGCSAHGDVIKFVAETTGISYREAAIKIANDNGIDLPKVSVAQEKQYAELDQMYNILDLAAQFFISKLTDNIAKYLMKRGVLPKTIEEFSLGFAPGGGELERFFEKKSIPLKDLLKVGLVGKKEDGRIYEIFNNRIIFPIRNIYNKVVGFGGRAIGDVMPKYINSPETIIFKKGEIMYGENIATGYAYKDNFSIVVEGYMDVIALHQAGFKQAVASLGTSVTEKHLQKLWRSADEIISCLDGDSAGLRASSRLINMAIPNISSRQLVSFIELPVGYDPDDFIKSGGKQSFRRLLSSRLGLSEMIWKKEYDGKNFKTAESRAVLEQKLEDYCSQVEDKTLKVNFRRYFKEMVWNKLVRKQSAKRDDITISQEVISSKKYSEIEVLEYSICALLLKYPKIICNIELKEILINLEFKDQNLNDFKGWFIEIVDQQDSNINGVFAEKIKSTRFYEVYLVLSSPDVSFLDLAFLNKDGVDQEQVFEWLYKKHYLLLLKQEFTSILSEGVDAESRSASYLAEIQRVTKELNQLSESFIN